MKLYTHQQKIIDEDPKKTGLFLGTGSGKTRIALYLAEGKTLVVAPKTQVEDQNWIRESKHFVRVTESTVTNEGNLILGYRMPGLAVISKETFRRDHESLPAFDTLIFDEAHTSAGVTPNVRYKKRVAYPKASQLFEAAKAYIERTKPKRLYLCTATPIRSPMTVWGLATLLGCNWDFYAFRDRFYIRLPMPGREVWTARSDSKSKDDLGKLVRKIGYTGRLEDYFDVPEQTYKTIHLNLTAEQKKRIKETALEWPDPLVRFGKILQIENGLLTGDEFNRGEFFENEKLNTIFDLALEFPKLVVFARFTNQINKIQWELDQKGYNVMVLTGDTKNRGDLIRKANESEACIFLCQSQISAGWELPTFPVMVFASLTYSVVDRIQAEGRILRANALKKNLYITLVARGGADEAVYKSIENKKDFDERIYLQKHEI